PILRDFERRDPMPAGDPAVEEGRQGEREIFLQPRSHSLGTTRCAQSVLVRLTIDVLIVSYLRWNKNPLQSCLWISDNFVAERGGIDIAGLHPHVARTSRIAGQADAHRHTRTRTQR